MSGAFARTIDSWENSSLQSWAKCVANCRRSKLKHSILGVSFISASVLKLEDNRWSKFECRLYCTSWEPICENWTDCECMVVSVFISTFPPILQLSFFSLHSLKQIVTNCWSTRCGACADYDFQCDCIRTSRCAREGPLVVLVVNWFELCVDSWTHEDLQMILQVKVTTKDEVGMCRCCRGERVGLWLTVWLCYSCNVSRGFSCDQEIESRRCEPYLCSTVTNSVDCHRSRCTWRSW